MPGRAIRVTIGLQHRASLQFPASRVAVVADQPFRRSRSRRPPTTFTVNGPRKLTGLLLLGAMLVLLINWSRDPRHWRWLAMEHEGETREANPAAPPVEKRTEGAPATGATEP